MSSNHKRKRTDDDESDEEPAYGMRQILPVANLPADFSGEPSDGMQYLFTVRRDAQKLPNVKYVPNPYDIPIVSSHDVDDVFDVKPQVGEAYTLPSAEWRDTFVRRFRNFRENMKQPTIGLQRPPQRRQVPEKANRDAWWAFLSGAPESHWNPPAKKQKRQARQRRGNAGNTLDPSDPAVLEASWELVTPVSIASSASSSYEPPREPDLVSSTTSSDQPGETEDASNEVSTSAVSSSGEGFQSKSPREPTPAFLQGIDHRFSLHLLMYFAHWITLHVEYLEGSHASAEAYTIYETHARWIFSLLARVDAFCTSDDTSTLRTLVRACLSLLRARHFPTQDDGHDSLASTPGPEAEDPQASANMVQTSYNQDASKSTVKTEENTPAELRDESVWLILAAVAEFWGQRDLWDDAQVVFSQTS